MVSKDFPIGWAQGWGSGCDHSCPSQSVQKVAHRQAFSDILPGVLFSSWVENVSALGQNSVCQEDVRSDHKITGPDSFHNSVIRCVKVSRYHQGLDMR